MPPKTYIFLPPQLQERKNYQHGQHKDCESLMSSKQVNKPNIFLPPQVQERKNYQHGQHKDCESSMSSKQVNKPNTKNSSSSPSTMFILSFTAFALLSAGLVCAQIAQSSAANSEQAFKCAFASVVCLIASTHYSAMLTLESKILCDDKRHDTFGFIRLSDWLITLPILQYDIFWLAQPMQKEKPLFPVSVQILLPILVVIFGNFNLFVRSKIVALLFWIIAAIIFVISTYPFLFVEYNDSSNNLQRDDKTAVFAVIGIQYLYPIVSIVSEICGRYSKSMENLFAIYGFAILDVLCKGLFGFYIASRISYEL